MMITKVTLKKNWRNQCSQILSLETKFYRFAKITHS